MKQILFLSLLLLSSLYAKSSDFSVIINKPFNDALLDITEDYNRDISAVGFTKNFKKNTNESVSYDNPFDYLANVSSKHGSQMELLKISPKAKVIFSKSTHLNRFNKAVSVVKTPQDGYFIGGYTLDGTLLVLKLDSNGNTLFSKEFGTKNYDRMQNMILLSDGGVLAVGSSVTSRDTSDNIFQTGLGLSDIYITRFTKDGQELWSKKFGTQYDDSGIDAAEAKDGSIVVLSTTSYDKNRDVTLMRITENGNKIWLKHYENKTLTIPHKIIRLRDDNFLVSLSEFDNMQKEQIRLIKFDLYKNVLVDKKIYTTYPSVLNDIKEYSDGTFIGVGYVKDTYNTDGLVMIIDSNLAMLTQEHYGGENYDTFNAVTILHNSQAAAAGIHTNENSQETNMWIAKFNKDATMAQKKVQTSTLLLALKKVFKEDIEKNRLRIKDDLSIEFIDKSLYFSLGKYKLTREQKSYLKQFGNTLVNFLSQHKKDIASLEINGHTSKEWGKCNFTDRYLKNAKLSLERAYSVLSYIFKNQDLAKQKVLTKILRTSGYSYTQNKSLNQEEDKALSRRVSFKIILK